MNSPTNQFDGSFDSDAITVTVCSALSLYNALELQLLIFSTFQTYSGLYFWALAAASFGIVPYVVGFMLEYFRLAPLALGIAIDTCGWALMVSGQSVVLYSRLWLVFGSGHRRLLNAVKWMIIVDGLVFHISTAVVVYGAHFGSKTNVFGQAYDYIERIQMTGFTIQEFILSGLYIWKVLDILNASERRRSPRVIYQLFSINVIIIVLDIGLLTIEYMNFHVLEQTVKGVTYSVKLKLELAVLNKLIELSRRNKRASVLTFGDTNDFLDPTRTVWDISRFTPAFATSPRMYPKWRHDFENSGLQRVESCYSPTDTSWTRTKYSTTLSDDENDYFPPDATIKHVSTITDPRLDAREKGSATDLLYADAVRRMAR